MAYFQSQYFTTNATIHITQDKEIFPMLLKYMAPFPKDQLHTKDQQLGQKYHR